MLVDDYFSDERYHLLSVCDRVNTHNAAGRMLLLNLANYNQFEREMISVAHDCLLAAMPLSWTDGADPR
jgi:DNA invertase Pin-like site-specific DNA recombinase